MNIIIRNGKRTRYLNNVSIDCITCDYNERTSQFELDVSIGVVDVTINFNYETEQMACFDFFRRVQRYQNTKYNAIHNLDITLTPKEVRIENDGALRFFPCVQPKEEL